MTTTIFSENQTELQGMRQHLKRMRLKCHFQDYRNELIRTDLDYKLRKQRNKKKER